jgi:hypothetical protein
MSRDDFQRRADRVRVIPLEVVLTSWGAVRDRQDTSRWRTPRGPLSITGAKFYEVVTSTARYRALPALPKVTHICHL